MFDKYRNIAQCEFTAYAEEFKEYRIGEIIASFIRPSISGSKDPLRWLRGVSNEDLYTAIEKAKEAEYDG